MTTARPATAALVEALLEVDGRSAAMARSAAMVRDLRAAHQLDGSACSCGVTAPCRTQRILDTYAEPDVDTSQATR